ncbi:MAG: hypothetical protein ACR2PA_13970 [Hyphomicrobiaceae bacterium]
MLTNATLNRRPTVWPVPFTLVRRDDPGAKARGCVIARSDLDEVANRLGPRAQRYTGLRLSFSRAHAIFWSTESCDLPWLPVPVMYLRPPTNRVFMPIGWTHEIPDNIFQSVLEQLPLNAERGTPVVLLPRNVEAPISPPCMIELSGSMSVAAVDWALLSRGTQ